MYPAHWAATKPDTAAVIMAGNGQTLTFADLDVRSRRLVTVLSQRGLGIGHHIAVQLPNTLHYFEIIWAALLSGAHVTPISSHATTDDVAYILADCAARLFITTADFADRTAALPARVRSCSHWLRLGDSGDGYESYDAALSEAAAAPVDPDAPMGDYMLYSSGTTGRPKGVRRAPSDRRVARGSIANRFLAKIFAVDERAVFLSAAPLYHAAPLGFSIGVTSLGGTVVIMDKFDARAALAAIERYRVTHSQWVPTMFIRMLALADDAKESVDLSSHRTAIHSAAPCPRHVKEAMMQWWGPILHEYYSSTEDVGVTYASPQEWLTHPGTVGRPPGFRIHICGDDGNELPPNATGLVYFETRAAGFAYHGDEDKTRESRQGGHWSRDLAYAISSCLDIEDRRNWENELIGRYLSVFAEHSGHQIPFDEAYLLYRQQIFAALQFWTITFTPSESMPDMQSSDIAIRNIERISTAVDDLDSIGAFA